VMTQGGPANSTDILVTHLYKLAFRIGKLGEASAVSLLMFAILLIFTMIYVNDISGAKHVPWWMKHFSDSFKGSGMTFVDLVFPAFLFIVGMSIPFGRNAVRAVSRARVGSHGTGTAERCGAMRSTDSVTPSTYSRSTSKPRPARRGTSTIPDGSTSTSGTMMSRAK